MNIVLLNGTLTGTKTERMLSPVETYLKENVPGITINNINLKHYNLQFVDGRPPEEYNDDMKELISSIERADGYVIATPVFQGGIPGALKNVFDAISPLAMRYKPVSIIAVGGTLQHHLVIENQLKPVLDYFRCLITPNYVYAHPGHFTEDKQLENEEVKNRLIEMSQIFLRYLEMGRDLSPYRADIKKA
ncbi:MULTISPECIES: NADPH-dependent FMN reductase [Salimicrobium]|uniref:FMN reductase n=2 Tax=Salimicrobium TaxID=351195 RepID=A0ABY1KVV8_9BACI|nr:MULTISPECIES: NAD(P)H-dependent oxidoreductase [Salimicrobium]SDY21880.1 FMN reductase [Salimicrobium album]SIS84841.1 FMN reductase [Salimicrobium salexigens]